MLIIRRTFCCHGVFVLTKDVGKGREKGLSKKRMGEKKGKNSKKEKHHRWRKQTGSMPLFVKARLIKMTYFKY